MKILITGFEPFGEHQSNPSQLLLNLLPDQYQDFTLIKSLLPVRHDQAPQKIINLLNEHQPDAVMAFGLAAGRAKISIERVAINLMDFSLPDNAGAIIENQPVLANSPAAFFSTLPVHRMMDTLNQAGIPAELSLTAGSYLCNQVFYLLMHEIHSQERNTRAGFIHLPALPEQAVLTKKPIPSMGMDHIYKAALLLVAELGQTRSAAQSQT